jgi:ribosomal protein L15E
MAFLNHTPCGYKIVVDHIDNNIKTDNRLENLQLITQRENVSKDIKNTSSKYIGVCWHKKAKKWRSSIQINGKY